MTVCVSVCSSFTAVGEKLIFGCNRILFFTMKDDTCMCEYMSVFACLMSKDNTSSIS